MRERATAGGSELLSALATLLPPIAFLLPLLPLALALLLALLPGLRNGLTIGRQVGAATVADFGHRHRHLDGLAIAHDAHHELLARLVRAEDAREMRAVV